MWGKHARAASVAVGLLTLAVSGAFGAQQLRRERQRRASIKHQQQKAKRPLYVHAPRYAIASTAAAAGFLIPALVISAVLHVAFFPLVGHGIISTKNADETIVMGQLVLERRGSRENPVAHASAVPRPTLSPPPIATPRRYRSARLSQPHAVLQVPVFVAALTQTPATPAPEPSSHPRRSAQPDVQATFLSPNAAPETQREAATPPAQVTASLAAPACAQPFVEARAIAKDVPRRPAIAEQQGAFGTSQIEVDLDERGQVVRASIYASSQNSVLDGAALDAALRSTYAPRIVNCRPSAGRYVYIVDFPA